MLYTEMDMFNMHELTAQGKTFAEAKKEILQNRVDCDEGRLYVILDIVCKYFDITEKQITYPNRAVLYVNARRAFSFLCKKFTGKSLKNIGRIINRDHATVLHQIRNTQNFLDVNDAQTVRDINAVTDMYFERILEKNKKGDEKTENLEEIN